MPLKHDQWDELGRELTAVRRKVKSERFRLGAVSEATQAKHRELMAKASAALVVDDIRNKERRKP